MPARLVISVVALTLVVSQFIGTAATGQESASVKAFSAEVVAIQTGFQQTVRPLLAKYCVRCHNTKTMKSGIRVDHLTGALEDRQLFLWKGILHQLIESAMPPADEPQPSVDERQRLRAWIDQALHLARTRKRDKNGSVRRLTVSQYQNTLRDLLGIEDQLTAGLPPDAISRDGFVNNEQTMLLSPLLVEAYFSIAEQALDLCIVDDAVAPTVHNFRMELGASINAEPFPEKLILGANSHLLPNDAFKVTELSPNKSFAYRPFAMRTNYRFIEGYQGNDTVRGWREYDSIYHAVFACMRGTNGYPKGNPYDLISEGLLLRPAIPSAELFQVESTYGPRSNFKISLRQLPDHGRFRVTVRAARYDDGLLLERGTKSQREQPDRSITVKSQTRSSTVEMDRGGIYQVDVHLRAAASVAPDSSDLHAQLIGHWGLDGVASSLGETELVGRLAGEAKFVDSPFGRQALALDGESAALVVPRSEVMNVSDGDFTVAAWIHPRGLRRAGIVSLGGHAYTHGWLLDVGGGNGVLRMITATKDNQPNGTVRSPAKVIRNNRWQHVAAVVGRGEGQTRLYVNGFEVAAGTVHAQDLDNPEAILHIGRIPEANLFKGEIDEVRLYRRALEHAEIRALVEPGSRFVEPPVTEKQKQLTLTLGNRRFSGALTQPAFLAVRLPAGPLRVATGYAGSAEVDRVVFTSLARDHRLAERFAVFEQRSPRVGVHVGFRRDCGSTLAPVGQPQPVRSTQLRDFVFEGAISNYPSPDVEKDNVNYLAGFREIGVRSEYTDGRDMPRLLIRSVEFEGPFYETWPPRTHRQIFVSSDQTADPTAHARDVIRSFATRAFRRPITEDEERLLLSVWEKSFAEQADFARGIKDALLVVLTSPQFLFLIENSESSAGEELNGYELASKLSYFLWNTVPDERLLRLAKQHRLTAVLDLEVTRMIEDDRFMGFVHEFASQWLSLDKFDVVEVSRERYPRLDRDTKTELRKEPIQFLMYVVRNNLPLRNLVQSDFIVANEVVASYYELGDRTERGFQFIPIKHESSHLGGLLSQASILAGLSDGRESNPVKRGAWLARKIIAESPEDPPPNVPALPTEEATELTFREKLERHRSQEGCAKCHAGIDPWGLPLEQFDAGGRFKEEQSVDATSTLPDGFEVRDAADLKAYLINERMDQVAFSFLKHLATYAIGRRLSYNEIEFLKEKGLELSSNGYRTQDLVRFVIQSELFLEK